MEMIQSCRGQKLLVQWLRFSKGFEFTLQRTGLNNILLLSKNVKDNTYSQNTIYVY